MPRPRFLMMARLCGVLLALAVGACSSAPPTDRLEHARAQVQAATADPDVQRYARPEVESAQDAFANAERGMRQKLDAKSIEYWAGIAEQRATIARDTGRQRRVEADRAAETERTRPVETSSLPVASGATERSTTTGAALTLTIGDDQFVGDGNTLKPDAAAGIDRIARLLQEDPTRMARIDGHSEDMNSRSRSLEFSGRRAEAVRAEFVRFGIDPRRVAVRALGDAFPVASNETPLGRQRNRRVDIYVVPGGAAQPAQ